MRSMHDKATREEVVRRINSLNEDSKALWGKMNVYQMVKHCSRWEEMVLGRRKYKQVLIGRIFGRIALKKLLKDDRPLAHNTPTMPDMKFTGNGSVVAEKSKWIALIKEYDNFPEFDFIHPFFGRMSKEQIGFMAYKHTDHHLRQFNS